MGTRTKNAVKVKIKAAEPAEGKLPVETLKVPPVKDQQRTVTLHFDIRRDEDGEIMLPKGKGGVRFQERGVAEGENPALGAIYLDQNVWALQGKPESLTLTVKADS